MTSPGPISLYCVVVPLGNTNGSERVAFSARKPLYVSMSVLFARSTGGWVVVYAMLDEDEVVGDMAGLAAFFVGSTADWPNCMISEGTARLKMDLPVGEWAVMWRFGTLRAPMWDMFL